MSTNKKRKLSFKVWIEAADKPVLGKGGAKILEHIQREESISKAAKNLGMSYRYVWGHLKKTEKAVGGPIVETYKGGKAGGGGAQLTKLGEILLMEYRRVEAYFDSALANAKNLGAETSTSMTRQPAKEDKALPSDFQYPIVFLPVRDLEAMRLFYNGLLGLPIVLDQKKCLIFRVGAKEISGYWGFCAGLKAEMTDPEKVCLTLVVATRKAVDRWHKELTRKGVICTKSPCHQPQFHIYNALFQDPMNYTLEIQTFDAEHEPRV
jgi:molybdate transport system regulatory protein